VPYRSYSEMSLALLKKMKDVHPKIDRSEQAIYLRLNSLKKKGSKFASNVSELVTPKQYKTPRGLAVERESPKAPDNQFIGTKVAKVFGSGSNGVLYSGSYNYKNIVFIYFYSFILILLLVLYYYYYYYYYIKQINYSIKLIIVLVLLSSEKNKLYFELMNIKKKCVLID